MKLKDKIIKINNGNYEDFISIWNSTAEKYSFTKLSSVENDNSLLILMMEDATFFHTNLQKLFKWFISLTLMEGLETGDIVDEDWCNKKTATIRAACTSRPSYNLYAGLRGHIFIGIIFERQELRVKTFYALTNIHLISQKYFIKGSPVVKENNSARLKELLSDDESPRDKVKGGLMRAAALPFVEGLDFKDTFIYFTFKPYQLDLGNGYKINMPKLKMRFCTRDRKFFLNDRDYVHPHISNSFVCLGTFQSVINSTRWNFDIALITMYEHACTYNYGSPFGGTRPFIETNCTPFYSKCTFEYLGMTYTWQEFTTHLAASFENRKDFWKTIMGQSSEASLPDWKSRFNISN